MKKIIVINGPNLNMLGVREPNIYGSQTLDSINEAIKQYAITKGFECEFYQSNCEGDLVSKIQTVRDEYAGAIINAGAYTHYSLAIKDAIALADKPFVEVHMSNVHAREEFRKTSVISDVCHGSICGFGAGSYILAVKAIAGLIYNLQ